MNEYERATRYLYSLKKFGSRPGLDRIRKLLALLGNPQSNLKVILVGGTSGKGSTCKFIESILRGAGYKVGLFTKPHMSAFTERFVVNGRKISEGKVAKFVGMVKPLCRKMAEHPTFFEVNTALAYDYFAKNDVDFAVMEVGMGGRLDSTNVVTPLVSVVTNIGLEHTKSLGETVAEIALEKAGIIRQNGIIITAARDQMALEVFRKVCRKNAAQLIRADEKIRSAKSLGLKGSRFSFQNHENLKIRLIGRHQIDNAAMAICAVKALPVKAGSITAAVQASALAAPSTPCTMSRRKPILFSHSGFLRPKYESGGSRGSSYHEPPKTHDMVLSGFSGPSSCGIYAAVIDEAAIRQGLLKARWPGRLEVVQKKPLVILDCAKDPLSMEALRESLLSLKQGKLFLILSISSDKKISMMVDSIMPVVDEVVVTKHGMMGRAELPQQLAKTIKSKFPNVPVLVVNNPKTAVEKALRLASPKDTVCITGSMFLVAEVRELWFPKKGRKAKIDSLNG